LKAYRKNRKGFTLIELIVVIVIIAILVAALTPAILGVIERANVAADEADARSLIMAASVAALTQKVNLGSALDPDDVIDEITGNPTLKASTGWVIYFDGPMAIGCTYKAKSKAGASIGDVNTSNTNKVTGPT